MPRPPKPLNPYASWAALFGATVQRLRVQLRPRPIITQAELGRRIGYSGSTVSAIERGMIRPDQKFVDNCERLGRHGSPVGVLPPAEVAVEESQLGDHSFLEPMAERVTEAKSLALY